MILNITIIIGKQEKIIKQENIHENSIYKELATTTFLLTYQYTIYNRHSRQEDT